MLEIKDLAGLSEPLCKVIDCFKEGVSALFAPWQYKRIESVKIEMEEKRSLSEQKLLIKNTLTQGIIEKAQTFRDKRMLENLGEIYSQAIMELANERSLPSISVSPDWSARFFDYSKDCSDDEVKILWSKILAGEIRKPGSYFKRTLSVLHNMEKFEAEWFVKLKPFIISDCMIPQFVITNNELMNYNEIQSLVDCGLINPNKCEIEIPIDELSVCDFVFASEKDSGCFKIVGYSLTDAGMQLSRLINAAPNNLFMKKLKTTIEQQCSVTLTIKQVSITID